jgi:hypothetical protein
MQMNHRKLKSVSISDSIEIVKEKLGISHEPASAPPSADPYLRPYYDFSAQGVFIFFDASNRVRTLAYKAPFAGDILGVKIGNSRPEVAQILNVDLADLELERNVFYTPSFLRIDFPDQEDRVVTIFL